MSNTDGQISSTMKHIPTVSHFMHDNPSKCICVGVRW